MGMADRPNILFLTVDALRADRTTLHGYGRPTTPNLERLAATAWVCDNAVSTAAFTQPAFHSFLTSSRPLSYGGYDTGVFNRPKTLFKAMNEGGYETHSLSTFQWVSELFGYDDGIDHLSYLFVFNALNGTGSAILRNHLERLRDGVIDIDQFLEVAGAFLPRLFDALESYCDKRQATEEIDRADFANSRFVFDGYDIPAIKRLVMRHRRDFERDRKAYVERHFNGPFQAHEYLAAEWRLLRTRKKLAGEAVRFAANKFRALVNPGRAQLYDMRFKRYVDGGELANRIIQTMERRDSDRPFFLWTHFIDTHIPYCAGRGLRWYEETPDYLESLGYDRGLDVSLTVKSRPENEGEMATWSALYDASVLYVDRQIGRIVDALDRLGLRDNTLLVICGDHGEELGEHGDISHHYRCYTHNLKIPLVFHNPGLEKRRIESLVSLLDIAPTIADMAGVGADPRWEGLPVDSPVVAERSHVILEIIHGGSCHIEQRPIYLSVRNKRFNYLWKEYRDETDRHSQDTPELYDFIADPLEQNNLYRPDHPLVEEFNPLIAERLADIPEISVQRILSAFGAIGQEAVRKIRDGLSQDLGKTA